MKTLIAVLTIIVLALAIFWVITLNNKPGPGSPVAYTVEHSPAIKQPTPDNKMPDSVKHFEQMQLPPAAIKQASSPVEVSPRFDYEISVSYLHPRTEKKPFQKWSDQVSVGCDESSTVTVAYELPPGARLVAAQTEWDQQRLRDYSADSPSLVGNTVVVKGRLQGQNRVFFNCPGGGQGRLLVKGEYEYDTIDLLSSENLKGAFNAPVKLNGLSENVTRILVEARPLGNSKESSKFDFDLTKQDTAQTWGQSFPPHYRNVSFDGQYIGVIRGNELTISHASAARK